MEKLVSGLRDVLSGSLPGSRVQNLMAPQIRRELVRDLPPGSRRAAVLVLLYPRENVPHIVLTRRRSDLRDHAGQISFPGGSIDSGESNQEAALREAQEELGIAPNAVDILGSLSSLYIPPSGFDVFPIVGACATAPVFEPSPEEVESILEVPVAFFQDNKNHGIGRRTIKGRNTDVPFFRWERDEIWGATAMMLSEFVWALETAQREE